MPACTRCGAELPEAARSAPPAATRRGLPEPGRERKIVTVLFADVVGLDHARRAARSRELKDLMCSFFAAMREEIEAEGGTVEKYIGDAIMAAFGVPAAHEDDPARAVRAATGC